MPKGAKSNCRHERKEFETTKPYSVERAEKAIRLFTKHKPSLKQRGISHTHLGYFYIPSYNFRARQPGGLHTLDLDIPDDNDSDEDYQPSQGHSKKRKPKQQLQPPPTLLSASRIVRIKFSSIFGKMLLQRLLHTSVFEDYVDDDDDGDVGQTQEVPIRDVISAEDKYMQERCRGIVRNIRTAYSHPIDSELGNDCGEPCEFCQDFTFGMFGLGPKNVEVIDYGTFLEEIEGGHRGNGHEPTRICNECALKRLRIVNCSNHRLSTIPGSRPHTFDFEEAFRSLTALVVAEGRREQINEWCSLCINPAFFRCRTFLIDSHFASDVIDLTSEAVGCGLLLCENCKARMSTHHRDLARVIAAIPASEGKRADVDFLVHGSFLNRYLVE